MSSGTNELNELMYLLPPVVAIQFLICMFQFELGLFSANVSLLCYNEMVSITDIDTATVFLSVGIPESKALVSIQTD